MNIIDVVLLSLILFSAIRGAQRGIVSESLSWVFWVIVIIAPCVYAPYFIRFLPKFIPTNFSLSLTYMILGFATFIIMKGLTVTTKFFLSFVSFHFEIIQKPIGAILGLMRGITLACLLLVGIQSTSLIKNKMINESWIHQKYGKDSVKIFKKYIAKAWINRQVTMI